MGDGLGNRRVLNNFISNLLNRNNAMQNMNNTFQKNNRTIPDGLFRSSINPLMIRAAKRGLMILDIFYLQKHFLENI